MDIIITNPSSITSDSLPVQRIPLGLPGDYKPMVVKLNSGELLLTAFCGHDLHQCLPTGQPMMHEDVLFFRSTDNGQTWHRSIADEPVLPREPYITVLSDGTLLMTTHFHGRDHRNTDRVIQTFVYRSTDQGQTWLARRMVPDEYPPGIWTHSSRNAIELNDGSIMLGISGERRVPDLIYRSNDSGLTWTHQTTTVPDKPKDYNYPLFAETVFWQSRSGRIFALVRVDEKLWPIKGKPAPPQRVHSDQSERLAVLTSIDNAMTWHWHQDLLDYGIMYPSLLRLADGRLLLTYTVRAIHQPLGVRAALGTETHDGFEFRTDRDIIIIDAKTPPDQPSGGGFGNTIQLDDGSLLTTYSYRDDQAALRIETAMWRL